MQKAEFYYCDDLSDKELTLILQGLLEKMDSDYCSIDFMDIVRTRMYELLAERFPKFRFISIEIYKLTIDGKLTLGVHAHRGWMVKLDLTKVHPLYRMDFYPRCFETKEEAEKELKYIRENALFTSYHHIPPEAYVVEDF